MIPANFTKPKGVYSWLTKTKEMGIGKESETNTKGFKAIPQEVAQHGLMEENTQTPITTENASIASVAMRPPLIQ